MRLLVCLEGPIPAEDLARLADAVNDIAPSAIVEMPQQSRTFVVGEGDIYIHIDCARSHRGAPTASGDQTVRNDA